MRFGDIIVGDYGAGDALEAYNLVNMGVAVDYTTLKSFRFWRVGGALHGAALAGGAFGPHCVVR